MKVLTFSLFCLTLVLSTPNIQLSLTQDTLNTALMTFYAFDLSSAYFYIGDFNYTLKSDLGDLDLKLTNINVTSVQMNFGDSVFALTSPDLITYSAVDLAVTATLDYDVKFGLIHLTPGSAQVAVTNTNISVTVALSETKGNPQIAFTAASLVLGDLDVKTQLPKEINDLLVHEVKDEVDSLSKNLLKTLETAAEPALNKLLAGLDLVISCPVEPLAVDLSLESAPSVVNDTTLIVGLVGNILAGGQVIPGPAAVPITVNATVSEGLQFAVADYVVEAILEPIWSKVDYNFTTLPTLGELSTSTLALLIPNLKWKYGASPVNLNVYTDTSSYLDYWTDAGVINLNGSVNADFWVYSKSNWVNALTLTFDFLVQVTGGITNNVGSVTINTVKLLNIAQGRSTVGTVNTSLMTNLVNSLATGMIKELNPQMQNYVSAM